MTKLRRKVFTRKGDSSPENKMNQSINGYESGGTEVVDVQITRDDNYSVVAWFTLKDEA